MKKSTTTKTVLCGFLILFLQALIYAQPSFPEPALEDDSGFELILDGKSPDGWREFVISENGRGRMVRSARYKYNLYKGGEPPEMLIDMKKDPGEMKNLATLDEYGDVIAAHCSMLYEWTKKVDDRIAIPYLILPENQYLNPN